DSEAAETAAIDPRFGGSRFGVVLHEALENADFAAWRSWRPGSDAPEGERKKILEALGRGGYAAEDMDDGVAVIAPMVGHSLTARLPEGTALVDVPERDRRPEI